MSYRIYWMEGELPKTQFFGDKELVQMLNRSEELRKAGHGFVASASENPDSVTKLGVEPAPAGYMWEKRRRLINGY